MMFKQLSAIAAVVSLAAFQSAANALTFDFSFDNNTASGITPPLVGSGTFNFDGDPGDGTFLLTSLPNYNFNFEFNTGDVFTTSDITTPVNEVEVLISSINSARQVNFSNINPFNPIEFRNASSSNALVFPSPEFTEVGRYALFSTTTAYFGTYQGLAVSTVPEPITVPEPSTNLALLTFTAVGVGSLLRRKQKKATVKI